MEMLRREAAGDQSEGSDGPRGRFLALASTGTTGERPKLDRETWGAEDPDWSQVTLQ